MQYFEITKENAFTFDLIKGQYIVERYTVIHFIIKAAPLKVTDDISYLSDPY